METLPPKTLKTELVHLDHNLKQIERSHHAGIQRAPGSLPVLEAFQEFLDNERKKARQRMMILTGAFVAILLIAGAGAGAAVYFQMKRMAVDYDAVSNRAADLESKLATEGEDRRSALEAIETRLSEDGKTTRTRHNELLAAQTDIADRVEEESTRTADMQAALDRLANENSALKEDLARVMKDWPSVTRQIKELAALRTSRGPSPSTRKSTVKPPAQKGATPAEKIVKTDTAPAGSKKPEKALAETPALALTIVPPGETHGIRWRLPAMSIPE